MSQARIAVVGRPGKWSTERLADAVAKATDHRILVDMDAVVLDLESMSLRHGPHNLCDMDAIIVKKISTAYSPAVLDRLEMLRIAESAGVRVFSRPESMLRLIDRLSCTVTLRQHDLPMPPTVITADLKEAKRACQELGNVVLKPLYSTKARGMTVIHAQDDETTQSKKLISFQRDNPVMYIQKKLELPGRDLGFMFLGGNYLGTYARVSGSDSWNTTIHSGGHYAACDPGPDLIDLARRAQAPFNMDFTTVDIAESEIGPIVFEVSAFGGFRGGKEGLGMDVASLYVDHVLTSLGAPA